MTNSNTAVGFAVDTQGPGQRQIHRMQVGDIVHVATFSEQIVDITGAGISDNFTDMASAQPHSLGDLGLRPHQAGQANDHTLPAGALATADVADPLADALPYINPALRRSFLRCA